MTTKDRPILFSAPMVRALLDGSKTQTRRVVKPQPKNDRVGMVNGAYCGQPNVWLVDGAVSEYTCHNETAPKWVCPHGQPGDRLWVRETFADLHGTGIEHRPISSGPLQRYAFAADTKPGSYGDQARKEFGVKWKPSIFMPRSASRITLEITGVRVERLQDISESDAMAEGVKNSLHLPGGRFAKENYEHLWWTLHGDGSWEANPWVWVIEFKKADQ